MDGIKFKYFIFTPPLLISFGVFFWVFNLIKTTLNFDINKIKNAKNPNYSYEILSTDNKLLSKLSRKFDMNNKKDKVPFLIKHAFISAEDKRFYDHVGIDLIGLSRAFLNNIKSGYIKEGGSTITQQVARLIYLNNDINFQRKLKEILISFLLEFKYTKSQILKIYLNNIYLGSGTYGVNEAAKVYFGKFLNELTLSEIALIAGLAPAPSIYSPFENLNLATQQRNKIINSMYLDGFISLQQKNQAINEIIQLNYQSIDEELNDKLLINFILNETNKRIENKNKYNFLKIKSSIKKDWQEKGQRLADITLPKDIEVALLSIESNTGLIRAMITGKNSSNNEFNRVTLPTRPLGSTFKIIPYTAALIEGIKLNDKFEDLPICWEEYCPKNFAENYQGKVSLIDSFKSSSNIIPIKITKNIGLKKIINLANLFGLGYKQRLEEYLPLAIGSYGENLMNITNAYVVFNSNGNLHKPSVLEKIESKNGVLIWENKFFSKRILDSKINKRINKLLEQSVLEGTSRAANIKGKKIYGKTGTSDGNRDLWFIGSINNLTTGIWIGFDENIKSDLSSGNAAFLWKKFISKVYDLEI